MAPSQVRITRFSFGKLIDHLLLVGWVLFKTFGLAFRGGWWLVHAPIARVVTLVVTLSLVGWWQIGIWAAFVPPLLALAGVAAWFLLRPLDFMGWWRAQYRYHFKLAPKWNEAMRAARLISTDQKHPDRLSKIVGVWGNEFCDFVEVQMLPYQTPKRYQERIEGLRMHLGYIGGRAVSSKHAVNHVTLELWKSDPLRKIVEPYPPRPAPEPGAEEAWYQQGLEVARLENGDPFTLDLVSTPFQWLVSGISGSGKSGAIWALLWAAQHVIRRKGKTGGSMIVDAIDPAMGMELTAGDEAGMFHTFLKAELPAWFKALSKAEKQRWLADPSNDIMGLDPKFEQDVAFYMRKKRIEMQVRGTELLGKRRKNTPSEATPINVIIIDEIASLLSDTANGDNKARKQIKDDLSEILRQGRKFGYMIIGAVQDPLKDQVSVRDLFTYFTAFLLNSAMATDKVLGDGSYKAGAHAPEIPRWLQGVAYTGNDFAPIVETKVEVSKDDAFDRFIRVRFCCVTDDHIRTLRQDDLVRAA